MATRGKLLSESDAVGGTNKFYRRESIAEYLTSRRGSLSDLVFSSNRKLSRDSILVGHNRISRHPSLTGNQGSPSTPRDIKQRSNSLIPASYSTTSQTSFRDSRDSRSEYRNSISSTFGSFTEKRFLKTKSLNNLDRADDSKRNSKGLTTKRRRWLRKLQSIKAFESVLKGRQNRKRFDPLVRFRRAVRTVTLLLKATASSRHASQHHDQQVSWSQLADDHSTARRTYDLFGISFDPTVFKAKREKYLSNEAKAILSLYPSDRTEDQLKLALLALNQTVDAFGEFPIKLQRSLASVGWYENFDAKRVIIRQGHMADNFYFILSGTAVVTILETHKDSGEEVVRTVAFLRKGNSFGELALMHGARRSATVTCKTNVELLAVSREDFIDIFMHIEKDKEPDHISFLRSIDLLRGWPLDRLPHDNPRICLFTFFRRGVLLCKDSNTTEWIYVIKSGTCRVLKDLVDTKPNIPGLEYIPYSLNQTYIKLPPIPHPKLYDSPRSRRQTPQSENSQKLKRLPAINKRSSEQLTNTAIDHQLHINEIFEKRHKVPRRQRFSEDFPNQEVKTDLKDTSCSKVFVQIQKLVPRDVFGLEQTVFGMIGNTTSCSLVSDGAECILINKKFFMQHLSDRVAKQIRKTIQPIPTEESLQQKLQDQANWDAYKSMTVSNFIVFRKQLHEHEAEALYL